MVFRLLLFGPFCDMQRQAEIFETYLELTDSLREAILHLYYIKTAQQFKKHQCMISFDISIAQAVYFF